MLRLVDAMTRDIEVPDAISRKAHAFGLDAAPQALDSQVPGCGQIAPILAKR
jgi:hypothetical protein